MRCYAGIGARATPPDVLDYMREFAEHFEKKGWVLRSGGAEGADTAFESGIRDVKNKDILLPNDTNPEAEEIARLIHPAWERCSRYARQCHGRNVMQVLGRDLVTPVEFVVAWTQNGELVGGTRTALVLAGQRDIPVFNLGNLTFGQVSMKALKFTD